MSLFSFCTKVMFIWLLLWWACTHVCGFPFYTHPWATDWPDFWTYVQMQFWAYLLGFISVIGSVLLDRRL